MMASRYFSVVEALHELLLNKEDGSLEVPSNSESEADVRPCAFLATVQSSVRAPCSLSSAAEWDTSDDFLHRWKRL